MSVRSFNFSVLPDIQAGNTVIDQMVGKMTAFQLANGGRAMYSFELPEPAWRFLGENHPERLAYKPAGTMQINDRIGSWGASVPGPVSGSGYRAFEGGPAPGNIQLLSGAGGANRCVWDDVGDQMWHVAGSTGSISTKQGVVKYSAARDEFVHWTSGGTEDGLDNAAALWPGRGAPHNFGMSAWNAKERRMYRMLRLPSGGNEFWPCWVNVANEQSYTTRDAWLAGRGTWFDQAADSRTYTNLWPQTVWAPHIGAEGSLIVLQKDSRILDRWDWLTRQWTRYAQLPTISTPLSGNCRACTLGRRGVTMVLLGENLYLASFGDGVNAFWRIHLPANGGAYTLDTNLAPCPVPMDLSGYGWPGTHTELCVLDGKIYAFHTDLWGTDGEIDWTGGVYRYDPNTDTWSAMLLDSWALKIINLPRTYDRSPHNFTVTEIPRLGAFLMAGQSEDYASMAWLFKPPL